MVELDDMFDPRVADGSVHVTHSADCGMLGCCEVQLFEPGVSFYSQVGCAYPATLDKFQVERVDLLTQSNGFKRVAGEAPSQLQDFSARIVVPGIKNGSQSMQDSIQIFRVLNRQVQMRVLPGEERELTDEYHQLPHLPQILRWRVRGGRQILVEVEIFQTGYVVGDKIAMDFVQRNGAGPRGLVSGN